MAEITKTQASTADIVPNYVWILLAVFAVFVYFSGLTLPLVGPDEPRYAQIAREMLDRGDWITPTIGGFPWFEKPALLYWFEMASYKLFGVNEFAARFGSALCGLGTVASLWTLGRSLSKNNEQRTSSDLANFLALIAASTLGIMVFSHGASFDIVITFAMTAALVCFFIFDQATSRTFKEFSLPLILFYVFIGFSLLAKGLIGIIFPFAIVAFYFVLSRKLPSRTFVLSLFWGTIVAVGVASIWYIPAYVRNGWPFIDEFIIQHHFQRFTSNKYQHPQPFYFFLWVLPLMILPWLPFFFAAVIRGAKDVIARLRTRNAPPEVRSSALLLFAASWVAVPLVFFSISGSKLPGYILPAVPGAIILTGIYMSDLVEHRRAWRNAMLAIAFIVFVGSIVLMYAVVPKFAEMESVKGLMTAASDRGHGTERVFGLHTISHSAEFYAAGRLLREPDGRQKKLYSPAEVVSEMQRAGVTNALVIVPMEYQHQLVESNQISAEYLRDNGETSIFAVTLN